MSDKIVTSDFELNADLIDTMCLQQRDIDSKV